MCIDAFDLIKKRLIPLFQEELDKIERMDGVCEIRNIPVNGYETVSYKITTVQSPEVRVFSVGSYKNIGYFMGTKENPTAPMRFMDYKGATLLIPTDETQPLELWCGGKYVEKIPETSPFLVKALAGKDACIALLEDHREMLVISISPRKELWLNNLLVGDENHLVLCDETGTTRINRKGWRELKESFIKFDKKTKNEALVVLRGLNSGFMEIDSERVQKLFQGNMDFALACKEHLPSCPHSRNYWFSSLGALI